MLVSFLVCFTATKLNTYLNTETFAPLSEYFLLRTAIMSAVIYAVLLRYFYIQQQWKIILQASALAEIQALRARIRPHFLFNSMNTIASLISFQPEKAEKAVEDLSDLFRASLIESNSNTLDDELSLINSYLDIETLRLGERLKLQWNIDKNAKDTEIPALILQPLVENAIYHGIEPLPEGGEITISAILTDSHLSISVQNPVTALTRNRQHKGNEMALDNIRQRLQLVYGGLATFTSNETKEEYLVTLKIPLGIREPL
jgi:two-component system sensor histidine kinase AlgZ